LVCGIDAGIAVNPDAVKAQMEGGAVYALTAAYYGQITIDKGRVQQSNFHDYPMLRINEMPVVEVHILDSGEAPGGLGEPGVPSVAPAVCNAIFAATGKRIRTLPIDRTLLKRGYESVGIPAIGARPGLAGSRSAGGIGGLGLGPPNLQLVSRPGPAPAPRLAAWSRPRLSSSVRATRVRPPRAEAPMRPSSSMDCA